MQVHLAGFSSNNSDAIIIIQCQCGSTNMLDEAGGFPATRHFVYRHGVPVKNLRCVPPRAETLGRLARGLPPCRERYRITLHVQCQRPHAEVDHLRPRPREEVLESDTVQFPPKEVGPKWSLNPPPATPYVNRPYDS